MNMDKKYNKLDPYLREVSCTKITLRDGAVKIANSRLKEILDKFLIPTMKKVDPQFSALYRKLHFSGSFYENLKVGQPNEFDLNLELRLPANGVEIHTDDEHPGFAQVCLTELWETPVQITQQAALSRSKWLDGSRRLLQLPVYAWMQSVVDRALREISVPDCTISRGTSGPVVTLNISCKTDNRMTQSFSVDLVPVFVFGRTNWPPSPVRQPIVSSNPTAEEWCIVPKAPNNTKEETFWRMSFYNQEKAILNDKATLKNVIKLFKLLRDCEGWHNLSSYYIKTVFLWENENKQGRYWNHGIGYVFVDMLKVFSHYLRDKQRIPFFWDSRHDLLGAINREEIRKIENRIVRIVCNIEKNLDDNPKVVMDYFMERNGAFPSASLSRRVVESDSDSEAESNSGGLDMGQMATGLGTLAIGIGAIAAGAFFLFRGSRRNE